METLNQVEVFPNPTMGAFNIRTTAESSTVMILDPAGKLIERHDQVAAGVLQIDLSGKAKGVYFVTVTDGHSLKREKVVVM